MNVLVIGDVHGCYYTLRQLLKMHWNPDTTQLVQVGDLVNKGLHTGKCIRYWKKLETRHPGKVFLIRGNHEQFLIDAYNQNKTNKTVESFARSCEKAKIIAADAIAWLKTKPLSWQNSEIFVTHAGISARCSDPFQANLPHSVITNRHSLLAMNQVQVVGHTVTKSSKPFFSTKENSWYLDTGAYLGNTLSALFFQSEQLHPKVIQLTTLEKDMRDT